MPYQNPIPSIDDLPQSRRVAVVFTFDNPVTQEEAAENISIFLHNNRLTPDAVKLVGDVTMRYKDPQNYTYPRPDEDAE